MATFVTHIFIDQLMSKNFSWLTADLRVLLFGPTNNTAYTNTYITDTTILAELSTSGTGYSRKTLTGLTYTYDSTKNVIYGKADNLTWTAMSGGSVGGWGLFVNVTGDTSSWWVMKSTDGSGFPANAIGGDFNLNWDSLGIVKLAGLTVAAS